MWKRWSSLRAGSALFGIENFSFLKAKQMSDNSAASELRFCWNGGAEIQFFAGLTQKNAENSWMRHW